jgi:hypothetical protein
MKEEARQSLLLAFFNRLSGKDKDLALKVSEAIYKESKDKGGGRSKGSSCGEMPQPCPNV